MNSKHSLCIAFTLLCFINAFPAEVDIKGVVVGCNHQPLSGVVAMLSIAQLSDTTGSSGNFHIQGFVTSKKIFHIDNHDAPFKRTIEVWSVSGKKMVTFIAHTNTEAIIKMRQILKRKHLLLNAVYLLKVSSEKGDFFNKTVGFNLANALVYQKALSSGILPVAGKYTDIDTLSFNLANFPRTQVLVSSYIINLDSIEFTKSFDDNMIPVSCVQQREEALALAEQGIALIKDSISAHPLGISLWQSQGMGIHIGNKKDITIECKLYGAYASAKSTGYRLETACVISGAMARNRLELLEPIITLKSAGGLIVTDSSKLDLNSKVVLKYGEIKDKKYVPIPEYKNIVIARQSPSLPFDRSSLGTIMINFQNDFNRFLKDSSAIPVDSTFVIDNEGMFIRDTLIVLNGCIIKNVTLKNKTIVCKGNMFIDSTVDLQNCMLFSDNLDLFARNTDLCIFIGNKWQLIHSGKHNSQFFTFDSINVNKNVKTEPLSLFICQATNKGQAYIYGGIVFESGIAAKGCALIYTDSSAITLGNYRKFILDTLSSFTGVLLSEVDINIKKVNILGHIWADDFETVNAGVIYKDWLFRTNIFLPPEPVPFPLIGNQPMQLLFYKKESYFFYFP